MPFEALEGREGWGLDREKRLRNLDTAEAGAGVVVAVAVVVVVTTLSPSVRAF